MIGRYGVLFKVAGLLVAGRGWLLVWFIELRGEWIEFDDLAVTPNDDRRIVLPGTLQHDICCLFHCSVGLFHNFGSVVANHGNSSEEIRLISAKPDSS